VLDLAHRSQSSFRLEVINQDGQVFVLLSGGGASVTLADEVNNQGFGRQLGNYGEYSGNPTTDETYVYTNQIISLLLKSKARSKVLIIAGGVANFTDVRATFAGVIKALDVAASQLKQQGVRIYVRRGGPYQAEGLATMKEFLEAKGLLGEVAGPEMLLSDIVTKALAALKTGEHS
jgi:ATP-citrate lyase beta-subunit